MTVNVLIDLINGKYIERRKIFDETCKYEFSEDQSDFYITLFWNGINDANTIIDNYMKTHQEFREKFRWDISFQPEFEEQDTFEKKQENILFPNGFDKVKHKALKIQCFPIVGSIKWVFDPDKDIYIRF